jgi:hypothetical protein
MVTVVQNVLLRTAGIELDENRYGNHSTLPDNISSPLLHASDRGTSDPTKYTHLHKTNFPLILAYLKFPLMI